MTYDTPVQLNQRERARLRKLIAEYSGLDESVQADNTLDQAVAQRLAAHGLGSLADYWPLLQLGAGSSGEMNLLVQLVTNKETYLFREMHQFETLRDRVLPQVLLGSDRAGLRIADGAEHAPLRLWSAGCSTGEEAYSLAITVLEVQAHLGKFAAQVIATDIDANALAHARRGCYGERSLRLLPDDLRHRYFAFDGQEYCVAPQVAELVTFRVYNLAEDSRPPDLVDLDVIFCRNVTIYLSDRARDRLNARLANSLREGGFLFVASAETMGHNRGRLELISTGNTFLFRKGAGGDQVVPGDQAATSDQTATQRRPSRPSGSPATPRPHPPPARESTRRADRQTLPRPPLPATPFQRALQAFRQQDYAAVLHHLDQIPADEPASLPALDLRAAALLQQERLEEAETACQTVLTLDPWHADAHFLLGLIFRQQGQAEAAIESLKQVVYLQPSHRDAHFFLAETYRALGLVDQARREYENTLNILTYSLQETSPAVSLREIAGINLTGLADNILRRACEANLRKLQGRPQTAPRSRSRDPVSVERRGRNRA